MHHVHRIAILVAGAALCASLCAAAISTSSVRAGDDLAARCEAVRNEETHGLSSDLVAPGLRAIAEELRKAGPSSLDQIEPALARSGNLRSIAPDVLAEWPCDRTRRLLVGLLDDPAEPTAASAAYALGELRGREVVDPLVAAAKRRQGAVLHNTLNALPSLGALPKALDLPIEATRSKEVSVRHSAYDCLASVSWPDGARRAAAAIETAMPTETDERARASAAAALRVLRSRLGTDPPR